MDFMHKYLKYKNKYYISKKKYERWGGGEKIIELVAMTGVELYKKDNLTDLPIEEIIKEFMETLLSDTKYFKISHGDHIINDYSNDDDTGLYNIIDKYIKDKNNLSKLTLDISYMSMYDVIYLLFLARYRIDKLIDPNNINQLIFLLKNISESQIKKNLNVANELKDIINESLSSNKSFMNAVNNNIYFFLYKDEFEIRLTNIYSVF